MSSDEKKERNMTPRGFLNKAGNAKSAEAFLKAHAEYLSNGELSAVTSPILAKMEAGTLFPTPALQMIRSAVFSHMLLLQTQKAETTVEKARAQAPSPTNNKPYIGAVYTALEMTDTAIDNAGNQITVQVPVLATKINDKGEEVELQDVFESPQAAARWVHRRLSEGQPEWRGEVIWSKIISSKTGLPMTDNISYDEALAALNKGKKSPFMHVNKVNGRLTGQMKVGQSKASFSRG